MKHLDMNFSGKAILCCKWKGFSGWRHIPESEVTSIWFPRCARSCCDHIQEETVSCRFSVNGMPYAWRLMAFCSAVVLNYLGQKESMQRSLLPSLSSTGSTRVQTWQSLCCLTLPGACSLCEESVPNAPCHLGASNIANRQRQDAHLTWSKRGFQTAIDSITWCELNRNPNHAKSR